MKKISYLAGLVLIITTIFSFNDTLESSPAVQQKYKELVAAYMEKEDESCRKVALQEARLTLGGEQSDGDEEDNSKPRLSKPKKPS